MFSSELQRAAAAFLLSAFFCAVAVWVGQRTSRFDDTPDGGLKPHSAPVPRIGGIAFGEALFLLLAIEFFFARGAALPLFWIIPLLLAWLLGAADDLRPLSPLLRLGVQMVGGALLLPLAAGASWSAVALLSGALLLPLAINSVNWNDGRNGLASFSLLGILLPTALLSGNITGSLAIFSRGHSGSLALLSGAHSGTLALLLIALLLGFLPFNLTGRLFMGDAGSYLLGAAVALLIAGETVLQRNFGPALGLLPLLADGAQVLWGRYRRGAPLMEGDRTHLYDRLVDRGWPLPAVIALYTTATLLCTLCGSLLLR